MKPTKWPVRTSICLSSDSYEQVKEICKDKNVYVSEVIRKMIEESLLGIGTSDGSFRPDGSVKMAFKPDNL